jgi:hypothetical protein
MCSFPFTTLDFKDVEGEGVISLSDKIYVPSCQGASYTCSLSQKSFKFATGKQAIKITHPVHELECSLRDLTAENEASCIFCMKIRKFLAHL